MGCTGLGVFDTKRDRCCYMYGPNSAQPYPYTPLSRTLLTATNTVYRTNTFPLIHAGFFHALLNIAALTPLLERFETENGTLTSLLLFFGRELPRLYTKPRLTHSAALSTIPAIIYVVLERGVLRGNTAVFGARYFQRLLRLYQPY